MLCYLSGLQCSTPPSECFCVRAQQLLYSLSREGTHNAWECLSIRSCRVIEIKRTEAKEGNEKGLAKLHGYDLDSRESQERTWSHEGD